QGVGLDLRQRAGHRRDEDRNLCILGIARERAGHRSSPRFLAKILGAAGDRFGGDGRFLCARRRARGLGRGRRHHGFAGSRLGKRQFRFAGGIIVAFGIIGGGSSGGVRRGRDAFLFFALGLF